MMLAIGCIQSLKCNTNTCPVGLATQNNSLMKGLVVEDKAKRTANYHRITVRSFLELIAAANVDKPSDLNRSHINRRVSMSEVSTYAQIYPTAEEGSLI